MIGCAAPLHEMYGGDIGTPAVCRRLKRCDSHVRGEWGDGSTSLWRWSRDVPSLILHLARLPSVVHLACGPPRWRPDQGEQAPLQVEQKQQLGNRHPSALLHCPTPCRQQALPQGLCGFSQFYLLLTNVQKKLPRRSCNLFTTLLHLPK